MCFRISSSVQRTGENWRRMIATSGGLPVTQEWTFVGGVDMSRMYQQATLHVLFDMKEAAN
jgi:hypothetical protein